MLALLFNSCKKDEPYNQYTDTAIATLQKCYNTETGLYKTTSWWNGLSISRHVYAKFGFLVLLAG